MKIKLARWLSLSCYLGLLGFGMAWAIVLGDVPQQRISLTLLMFAPLLLPLRGLLHGREKSIIYATLVALLYLIHGGTIAWADTEHRIWGLLEFVLALGFVISASYFIRWRAQAQAIA